MPRPAQVLLLVCVLLAGGGVGAQEGGEGAARPDPAALLERAEAALRGDTTLWVARMRVVSSGLSAAREWTFEAMDDRRHDRAFVRVLSHAKEAGTSYLKLPPNVWRYSPRLERIARIPSARTLQPWLGGDFTLDDWLHVTAERRDYEPEWRGTEPAPDGGVAHVVVLSPRASAAVAWGRIEVRIEAERGLPLRRDYFDREGKLARTLRYGDFRESGGRLAPYTWVMKPVGDTRRETRVSLERIVFDGAIDEAVFSAANLKRAPRKRDAEAALPE